MYWLYILLCNDNTFYVGMTGNIFQRYIQHATGNGAQYTKARLPIKLVQCWTVQGSDRETHMLELTMQRWNHDRLLHMVEHPQDLLPAFKHVRGWTGLMEPFNVDMVNRLSPQIRYRTGGTKKTLRFVFSSLRLRYGLPRPKNVRWRQVPRREAYRQSVLLFPLGYSMTEIGAMVNRNEPDVWRFLGRWIEESPTDTWREVLARVIDPHELLEIADAVSRTQFVGRYTAPIAETLKGRGYPRCKIALVLSVIARMAREKGNDVVEPIGQRRRLK